MAEERLSHGALIKELMFAADVGRLQYELVDGTGPATGWVSIALKEKVLVERTEAPEQSGGQGGSSEAVEPRFPNVYFDTPGSRTHIRRGKYKEKADAYFDQLTKGEITGPLDQFIEGFYGSAAKRPIREFVKVPGRQPPGPNDYVDEDFLKICEQAEKGYAKVQKELDPAVLKMPPPFKKLSKAQLTAEAPKEMPGDMYGIVLPPNLAALESYGAEWLTKALHAAGTLPQDNAVKQVVKFKRLPTSTELSAGGAGPKAFMTVEYEKPDDSLHTELFVKLPWSVTDSKVDGGDDLWRFILSCQNEGMEFQECTVYRFMGPIFPFKIPKYYFGDICRETTNYVLITEKVLFGGSAEYMGARGKKDFKPYEIMSVSEKYFDFNLEPRMRYEMYFCLMRAQARVAAWDMLGKFDSLPNEVRGMNRYPPPIGSFDWPVKMKPQKRETQAKSSKLVVGYYRELLGDLGKRAYPKEFSDPKFLDALEEMVVDTGAYSTEINLFSSFFPHMIALQHTNLQADNAYYWRNSKGELDCGIIDWGGASPSNVSAGVLCGCLTGAEGEILHEYDVRLLRCFKDEYYRECGIELDLEEMERLWHLQYCNYVASCGISIEREIFRETPRKEWKDITDLMDKRVVGRWNCRCFSFMIRTSMRYLYLRWRSTGSQKFHCYDTFREWKAYWIEKGMT